MPLSRHEWHLLFGRAGLFKCFCGLRGLKATRQADTYPNVFWRRKCLGWRLSSRKPDDCRYTPVAVPCLGDRKAFAFLFQYSLPYSV